MGLEDHATAFGAAGSDSELAQMMVEVLVHQDRPLLRGELAEEGVGMHRANGGATGGKAVDYPGKAVLLFGQVAVVVNHKTLGRGGVAAHRDLVLESHGLDDAANDSAHHHPWRRTVSQ